ncbi:hypothetical protein ACVW0Y_003137 [Pseudomonas sp. TE3786]
MERNKHDLPALFQQLGLPSEPDEIAQFIASHSPLPDAIKVSKASFWSPSQQAFLQDEILDDSDWAPVVDQLNVLLRKSVP